MEESCVSGPGGSIASVTSGSGNDMVDGGCWVRKRWDPCPVCGPWKGSVAFPGLFVRFLGHDPLNFRVSLVGHECPFSSLWTLSGICIHPSRHDPADCTAFQVKVSFTWRLAFSELGRHTCLKAEGQTIWSLEISSSCKMNGSVNLFTLHSFFFHLFLYYSLYCPTGSHQFTGWRKRNLGIEVGSWKGVNKSSK